MNNELADLVLTCNSWQQAQALADTLLEKKLASNVETLSVEPNYKEQIHKNAVIKVKLVIQIQVKDFDRIKNEVKVNKLDLVRA